MRDGTHGKSRPRGDSALAGPDRGLRFTVNPFRVDMDGGCDDDPWVTIPHAGLLKGNPFGVPTVTGTEGKRAGP